MRLRYAALALGCVALCGQARADEVYTFTTTQAANGDVTSSNLYFEDPSAAAPLGYAEAGKCLNRLSASV